MVKQRQKVSRTVRVKRPRGAPVVKTVPARQDSLVDERSRYAKAMVLYEQGVQALQNRDFLSAARTLRFVVEKYPDERELHERARLYLRICERETGPPAPTPKTLEEHIYAATLALNLGAHNKAMEHLLAANNCDSGSDHVYYMLAIVYTLLDQKVLAVSHLRRAIDLNPNNRVLARQAADFEPLRQEEGFQQAIEPPPVARRRRRVRSRVAR